MKTQSEASADAGARTRAWSWRGAGWITAAAIALLAISQWLSATSVGYLLDGATATAVMFALLLTGSAVDRRWGLASAIALSMAIVLAANTQTQLARLSRDWPGERQRGADAAMSLLAREVTRLTETLQGVAREALAAPADRSDAFAALHDAATSADIVVVLYRGDSAFAWAGQPHVSTDSLMRAVGVTGSAFYLALYVTTQSADQRVVATRLLYAVPPADRLAASLAGDVAARAGVAGFDFAPPADSVALTAAGGAGGGAVRVIRAGGGDLFAARPILLTQGEVQLRLLERARLLVGLLLGFALASFIVAAWRERRELRWRERSDNAPAVEDLCMQCAAPEARQSNWVIRRGPC